VAGISGFARNAVVGIMVLAGCGCHTVRQAESPIGPHFRVLTYNINWGGPKPDLAAQVVRESGADIICLQETTPEWAQYLRTALAKEYPYMQFRDSAARMGGGLAFLSRVPGTEVAYIPSQTQWFDGWIMAFDTAAGPAQILNVHLHPPVGKNGYFNASGYLFTGQDRLQEIQRFFPARRPGMPTLVMGDFNDTDKSPAIEWLKQQGMMSALPQFDSGTPTWHWSAGPVSLHRRMDHILYSGELHCDAAEVIRAGASDHFPVAATLEPKL